MMRAMTYAPLAIGVGLIVGFTVWEARLSDRFADSSVTAEQFAARFAEVPKVIGDWVGEDQIVDDEVLRVAGAQGGYVSRIYRNERTNQEVDVWLIVGHSRDICRHTPDICYPSSGFHMRGTANAMYPISYGAGESAYFWTNTFELETSRGADLRRVFWSWYKPEGEDAAQWEAPEWQRWHFGNTRALYKLYLTSSMLSAVETPEQSPCIEFGKLFLPVVSDVLASEPSAPAESGPLAQAAAP